MPLPGCERLEPNVPAGVTLTSTSELLGVSRASW